MRRVAVIMAGGSGERFWPLSRMRRPKQLLRLVHPDRSMLQDSLDKVAPMIPASDVYVQTSVELVEAIRRETPELPPENVLAEPCRRNTAGCLCYAAAALMARHGAPEELAMAVLTADHAIRDGEGFLRTVDAALNTAEQEDALVTIGIPPSYASTGYGYIHADEPANGLHALKVLSFVEKPNLPTAEEYLRRGGYYWNSGMFFWRVSTFLNEFDQAAPEFSQATRDMAEAMRRGDPETVTCVFAALPSKSIDYALMEKARRVRMVPAAFDWDDIGTWPALDRIREADENGNITQGEPLLTDCANTIVYNEPGAEKMAVCVAGVRDLVVVVTGDAVLVMPKDRAENLRAAVDALKQRGAGQV